MSGLGYPLSSVKVVIHSKDCICPKDGPAILVQASLTNCIVNTIRENKQDMILLEPYMTISIKTNMKNVGTVSNDITSCMLLQCLYDVV